MRSSRNSANKEFKLAKIKGAKCPQPILGMDCNAAPESLAIQGRDSIRFFDSIVVPKGVVHRPRAEKECHIFLIEPQGVKNNGDADVEAKYDAPMGEWV